MATNRANEKDLALSTEPALLSVLHQFLDDELVWQGAVFRGVLCDADGNVVPWEADVRADDGGLYVLEGVVETAGTQLPVKDFFARWRGRNKV